MLMHCFGLCSKSLAAIQSVDARPLSDLRSDWWFVVWWCQNGGCASYHLVYNAANTHQTWQEELMMLMVMVMMLMMMMMMMMIARTGAFAQTPCLFEVFCCLCTSQVAVGTGLSSEGRRSPGDSSRSGGPLSGWLHSSWVRGWCCRMFLFLSKWCLWMAFLKVILI